MYPTGTYGQDLSESLEGLPIQAVNWIDTVQLDKFGFILEDAWFTLWITCG